MIVTYALHNGGMETHLLSFADYLHGSGHDVRFLVTAGVGAWHDRPAKTGIPVDAVLQRPWESKIRHARRVLRELNGHDVVMLNHCAAARAVVGSVDPDIAVVSMIHTNHPDDYPLGLSPFGDIDCTICPSKQIHQTALAHGAERDSLAVVPCAVRVDPAAPAGTEKDWETRPLKIAYVGRLVDEHKGILNLPAIAARFAAKYDRPFRLDVMGDGPDLVRLKREIARFRVEAVISLVGGLSHDEVLTRLPRYDVLLMPSRYEGFGIVMLEAMAAGVVPVVTHLPGITDEVIDDGVNGFLVPRDDVAAFTDALDKAASPSKHSELSRAAWATVRDRFDSEQVLARHTEVLAKAVQRRYDAMAPRSGLSSFELLGRGGHAPRFLIDTVKRGRKYAAR